MNDAHRALLKQHQEILAREAQSQGEERDIWAKRRDEIELKQKTLMMERTKQYRAKSMEIAPRTPLFKNMMCAFGVGGFICAAGQGFILMFQRMGMPLKEASTAGTCLLITISALLTGLGIYDNIGKHAGAGSIVPVTGFSNSIASAALEFKREGFLYGVGAKIFTVAGPVILYGIAISVFLGLIRILF
jgi:stage V sporulation protein AC